MWILFWSLCIVYELNRYLPCKICTISCLPHVCVYTLVLTLSHEFRLDGMLKKYMLFIKWNIEASNLIHIKIMTWSLIHERDTQSYIIIIIKLIFIWSPISNVHRDMSSVDTIDDYIWRKKTVYFFQFKIKHK